MGISYLRIQENVFSYYRMCSLMPYLRMQDTSLLITFTCAVHLFMGACASIYGPSSGQEFADLICPLSVSRKHSLDNGSFTCHPLGSACAGDFREEF